MGDFYVDRDRLSGDWYGYGLTRHTLRLAPGSTHTLSVRVAHEVRIFGGVILPPPAKVKCELLLVTTKGSSSGPEDYCPMVQVVDGNQGGLVVMDTVDGLLAGEWISIALRNVGPLKILVKSVKVVQGSDQFSAELGDPSASVGLFSGTHRPIVVRLTKKTKLEAAEDINTQKGPLRFSLAFEVESVLHQDNHRQQLDGKHRCESIETDSIELHNRTWGEPYHYTFRDFDGTVHYAAAIPPRHPQSAKSSAPVLVAFHGAGNIQKRSGADKICPDPL